MAKLFKPPKNALAAKEANNLLANVKTLIRMANEPEGYAALAKPMVATRFDAKSQVPVRQSQLGKVDHNTSVELNYQTPVHKPEIISNAPNANAQAVTPNGKPAQPGDQTATHGDPVSLFSGEELLTLTDFTLPGVLPFAWRRLYRTSAVEQRGGMGPGWVHSASPYLSFVHDSQSQEAIVWFCDDENRATRFLLPTAETPVVTNRAGGGLLSLKQDEFGNEYCVQLAGGQGTYHFLRDGDMAWLRCIRDRHGNSVDVSYDSEGRLAAIGHDDVRLSFSYDDPDYPKGISQVLLQARNTASTRPETHWQPGTLVAHYRYNEQQQLISATNAAGDTEYYRYRDDHVILCRTLAGGAEFHWEWQGEGKQVRCLRQYGNFGQLDTHYHWDEANHSVTLLHQDGSQQRYQHSAQARLVLEKNADGAETHYEYNDDGACIRVTDALGYHTDSIYDENGTLQCVITPDGHITSYDWLFDQLLSRTEGDGDEAKT